MSHRHTRAQVRYQWLRVGRKRRQLYDWIWGETSQEYLDSVSLNQHADMSLGKRCSCSLCDPHKWDSGRRSREKREWKRFEENA